MITMIEDPVGLLIQGGEITVALIIIWQIVKGLRVDVNRLCKVTKNQIIRTEVMGSYMARKDPNFKVAWEALLRAEDETGELQPTAVFEVMNDDSVHAGGHPPGDGYQ